MDVPVCHRVVEVVHEDGRLAFLTQGDAAEEPDDWIVDQERVLGKTVLHVPWLGFISRFVSTRSGFLVMIVLPGLLLVALQTRDLLETRRGAVKRERGLTNTDQASAVIVVAACLLAVSVLWGLMAGSTHSRRIATFQLANTHDRDGRRAYRRIIHNPGPLPLVICTKSLGAETTINQPCLFLHPGHSTAVRMETDSSQAVVTTGAFLPVLPIPILQVLFHRNHRWAPFMAAVLPVVPFAAIGLASTGILSPRAVHRRRTARSLRKLGRT